MKEDDPEPAAPQPPGPRDCCHSGCTWCVDDLYQDELEKYRAAHQAWLARRDHRNDTGDTGNT
ncbi:oxidoreductase-like domain-containing protein [Duganella sp. CF517]|uniref:oxidoreductase-like domain-containing protein n=1 Tax=Duganella sp. CF517 TaxID=1881038 RepID=UPI001E590566|nr:oxidoreductase-like domain-containing protein [Duganella sp. CF517]